MPVALNGSTSGSVTITAPAVAGTNTLTLPAVTDTLVGLAATQTLTNKTLTGTALSAGTTSVAPINLATGTNLTTATAGAMEYDGKVFYGTPQGTQRGVIPGAQLYRLDANYVGTATTSAQGIFGATLGVTLSSSTVYAFEMVMVFQKAATATAHTFSLGFSTPGSSINNILYGGVTNYFANPFSSITGGNPSTFFSNTVSATSIGSATASANFNWVTQFRGTVSVNVGGTFIPQYTTSVSVGPYSTLAGSYILIYPIGASGSNVNVGTWA
jgi:hypothetical protein